MSPEPDGRFLPDRPITRDEGFAILSQAAGVPQINETETGQILAQYPGSERILPWFRKNMAIALRQGIVNLEQGLRPRALMQWQDLCYGFDQLGWLQIPVPEADPAAGLPPYSPKSPGTPAFWLLAIFLTAIALTSRALRRSSNPQPPRLPLDPPAWEDISIEQVKALLVTEQNVSTNGLGLEILRRNVLVILGPATFGTDASCTYIPHGLPNLNKLFVISATQDGGLLLLPEIEGIRCGDRPIPMQGMQLSGQDRFTVEYEGRQWLIQPQYELPQHRSPSAYFAQLQAREQERQT
jgi:hypothetical protein